MLILTNGSDSAKSHCVMTDDVVSNEQVTLSNRLIHYDPFLQPQSLFLYYKQKTDFPAFRMKFLGIQMLKFRHYLAKQRKNLKVNQNEVISLNMTVKCFSTFFCRKSVRRSLKISLYSEDDLLTSTDVKGTFVYPVRKVGFVGIKAALADFLPIFL